MRRTGIGIAAALVLAAAALVPAIAFGGARAATTHTVVLKELRFHPSTLTIRRGDSVRWLWRDSEEHNVTFRSTHSRTQTSGSFTVRFTHSGTFNYRCTIHEAEGMRGKIVVH
jgi:plastocyanin